MALQKLIENLNQKARPPIETTEKGIPFDTLKTLYLDAFNRVGWKIGLMARPEVTQAEDRLNEIWLEAMEGQTSLENFKATLKEWEGTIRQVLKEAVNA